MSQFSLHKCLLSHFQGFIWTNLSNKISASGLYNNRNLIRWDDPQTGAYTLDKRFHWVSHCCLYSIIESSLNLQHSLAVQGVPLRLELGPRDIKAKQVVLVRRDTAERITVPDAKLLAEVTRLLDVIQQSLYNK